MKTVFLTGYRSFELGVFKEKDAKVKVIKKVIKKELIALLEEGLAWIIVGGNLGVEIWAAQVVLELKADYPDLKLGIIFPFAEFGSQWNDTNKQMLQDLTMQADFVDSVSHKPYESPQQLKNYTIFILTHTEGTLMIYDDEFPGKSSFFLKDAKDFGEKNVYEIRQITMDDLQNAIIDSNLL